ncbi:GAF domain-containing protein [Marinobacter sp. CA1]|uniref:GAF domain-containing protein n=1 Tax=Marinobacter sp. CA1 TaxID=2817656 RepID=UPI001D08BEFE|nr:GAF domain-containing protein [Marinobacter sp. CA1]UDL04712.1 PAS domain S-box protein [Marinobacter sp. CA1]
MRAPEIPENETERLRSLGATGLLDSPAEERFDRLTRVAQRLFGVEIALVSLVDADRQWFKSRQGLDALETPRSVSFCGHAILNEDILVVENAAHDSRFHDNPLVCGSPNIRFYAGAPLHSADGFRLGTLCIIDSQPRTLSAHDRRLLRDLADSIEAEIGQSQQKSYYRTLEALSAIHNDTRRDPIDCLREGLRLGCDYLKLPFGIISQIEGDRYTVLAHASPPDTLHDGQAFDLNDTYCSLTLDASETLAIENMGQSQYASHPCYREFGLESYLGTALVVAGQPYGTLNFSSPSPREPTGFNHYDFRFMELLSGWTTAVLERWQVDQTLSRLRAIELAVARAQASFINRPDNPQAFTELLDEILRFTDSAFGFIGEILKSPEGQPYLKTDTITNIAWDEASRAFYRDNINEGLEFHNLDTLFGQVMTTGQPVLANDLPNDSRGSGVPHGHPPIHTFMGLPIYHGSQLVGMLGLANREQGYDRTLERELGPLLRTIGQLREATRVQRSQRESERRLEMVIRATDTGIWEWNVQTDALTLNERWAEIIGYRLEELSPLSVETWRRLLHEDDLEKAEIKLRRHFAGASDYYDATFRMRHQDGHWVWVHARGRVMAHDIHGDPLIMAGTHTDISAQKAAELRLKESEARLRALFELSPVGIALNDFDTGQFIQVNDALLASAGYGRLEFLSLSYWDVTPKDYADQEAVQLERLENRGHYGPYEKEFVHRNGHRYPVMLHGTLLTDASGRKLIWSIVEDITERKRLTQMQREFVSTVSHELRTPLTAITAALSMVGKGVAGALPEKAQDMVSLALRNSERLSELINDILDMEKLAAGKMPFELERCDLLPLLKQVLDDTRSYADRFQVQCLLEAADTRLQVRADPRRLIQVMTNLLSNAIKFSHTDGAVRVLVEPSGERVRVRVEDRGRGVPAAFRDRLFSAFAQADSSDSRQSGGTGLGLVISQQLMEGMHGDIGFEDTPGGGATFYIELPLLGSERDPGADTLRDEESDHG